MNLPFRPHNTPPDAQSPTLDTGTYHYELALRELIHPCEYVNNTSDGAEMQTWDETIATT